MPLGTPPSGPNVFIQPLIRRQLISEFFEALPLFNMLTGKDTTSEAILSYGTDPNVMYKGGLQMGGMALELAERDTLGWSIKVRNQYQKDRPNSASQVEPGAVTPTATVDLEDLWGSNEIGWTTSMIPMQVRNSSLAQAGQISNPVEQANVYASIYTQGAKMVYTELFQNMSAQMWNGVLTQAQQARDEWDTSLMGIRQWVSDGTGAEAAYRYVGSVDRTTASWLQSKVLTAVGLRDGTYGTSYLQNTQPTLQLIDLIKTIPALGGLVNKSGIAGDLVITTPELYNVLKQQIDNSTVIVKDPSKGLPLKAEGINYKFEVIQYGGTAITYDKSCPPGEMYVLSTGTFVYQLHSSGAYTMQPWINEQMTVRGGRAITWSAINVKHRLFCTRPALNVKITGLTVN
jgi:hypothetical protein